uniref:DUF7086 domain-containing protein n=1 Tax=Oryza punctata TaxID=4537 RepID=A0A0E0L203_ORYPU
MHQVIAPTRSRSIGCSYCMRDTVFFHSVLWSTAIRWTSLWLLPCSGEESLKERMPTVPMLRHAVRVLAAGVVACTCPRACGCGFIFCGHRDCPILQLHWTFNVTSRSVAPHHHHQRHNNTSTTTSSGRGSCDNATPPTNISNAANNGGNDKNNSPITLSNPLYPWATNRAGQTLLHRRALSLCSARCKCQVIIYKFMAKFQEVANYFIQNHQNMHDHSSKNWMKPNLPDHDNCGQQK